MPNKYKNDENTTLYLGLEKNVLDGRDLYYSSTMDKNKNRNEFRPPGAQQSLVLTRSLSLTELNDLNMKLMPGFRLIWHYSRDDGVTSRYPETSTFRR